MADQARDKKKAKDSKGNAAANAKQKAKDDRESARVSFKPGFRIRPIDLDLNQFGLKRTTFSGPTCDR